MKQDLNSKILRLNGQRKRRQSRKSLLFKSQLIKKCLLIATLAVSVLVCRTTMADLVVVVHPSNPITTLNKDEVRQIFLGRMRLYPATQKNIDPVDQDTSLPSFDRFYRQVANLTPTTLQRLRAMYLFSGKGMLPKILPNEIEVIQFVANHPDAIGYIQQSSLDNRVKPVFVITE